MRHVVDFRTNSDLGEFDANSIVPYVDGEPAGQTVFRRPPENLRTRSDTLRGLVRNHVVLLDLNQAGPLMWGGGTITFAGASATYTGIFTTSADLLVSSFATPGDDTIPTTYIGSTQAVLMVGTPASNQVVFTSVQKQFQGATLATADASWISVEIVHTGSVSIVVNDLHNIYITINAGTTTCNDVIAAVAGLPAAAALVTATLGGGSTGTNPAATWTTTDWAGNYARRFLEGGVAGVTHVVPASAFSNFFATPANVLRKGDTLAIWYNTDIDATGTGGRFQSTPENANTVLAAANLFNSRREPAKIPNSIPICKCVNDDLLIFADGSYIYRGTPAELHADSTLLLSAEDGLLSTPLGWVRLNAGTHTPPTTIRQALDNTDQDLDTVMTEVETARSSTIFGAAGSLDARCEAGDTHSRAFVSVTDGTLSTGGLYNGTTALETAILAMEAGEGGRILVRRGNYTISTALVISSAITIIGVEDDVIITSSVVGSRTFLFSPTASRPSQAGIENVVIIGQLPISVTTDAYGSQVVLKNLWVHTSGADVSGAAVLIEGAEVVLENIYCERALVLGYGIGADAGITFTGSANKCALRNVTLTNFSASLNVGGQRITCENIQANINFTNDVAVTLSGNDNVVRNIYVPVNGALTPTGTVFSIQGTRCRLENASCQAHSRCLLFGINAADSVAEGLTLAVINSGLMLQYDSQHMNTVRQVTIATGAFGDYAKILNGTGGQDLHLEDVNIGGSSKPGIDIIQLASGMVLRNVRVTWDTGPTEPISERVLATGVNTENLLLERVVIDFNHHKLMYGTTSPIFISGWGIVLRDCSFINFYVPHDTAEELDPAYPVVQYESNATAERRILFENCNFGTFSHAVTPSGNMSVALLGCVNNTAQHGAVFRGCHFDTTGITYGGAYPYLGGRFVFWRTGAHTVIDDCYFDGSGKFTTMIQQQGGQGLILRKNHTAITNCPYQLISGVEGAYGPHNLIVDGNIVETDGVGGQYAFQISGTAGIPIDKVVLMGNIVKDGANVGSFFLGYITKLTGFGNIADHAYVGIDLGGGGSITTQTPATWALGNI
jgi:hypothetical protein